LFVVDWFDHVSLKCCELPICGEIAKGADDVKKVLIGLKADMPENPFRCAMDCKST